MSSHTHRGYPGVAFADDDCFICRGEAPAWPAARAACGCTPVTDCPQHRKETR